MSRLSATAIVGRKIKQCLMMSVGVLCIVQFLAIEVAAADLDTSQRFLLLATKKTKTMQKELDEALLPVTGSWLAPRLVGPKWP